MPPRHPGHPGTGTAIKADSVVFQDGQVSHGGRHHIVAGINSGMLIRIRIRIPENTPACSDRASPSERLASSRTSDTYPARPQRQAIAPNAYRAFRFAQGDCGR
jgi:hypothetical protein